MCIEKFDFDRITELPEILFLKIGNEQVMS